MFFATSHNDQLPLKSKFETTQDLFTTPDSLKDKELQEDLHSRGKIDFLGIAQLENQETLKTRTKEIETSNLFPKHENLQTPFKALVDPRKSPSKFTRETNPFFILGAYPEPEISLPYEDGIEKKFYDKINYGLFNDKDYCERVDYYNLAHPENIFEKKNFFTDFARNSVVRHDTIPKIGKDVMKKISLFNKKEETKRKYHFDITINTFFINMDGFEKRHEIGKNFLCATQMYNRIPGSRALVRKDDLVESVDQYAKKYANKPHCFNKQMFFPLSYRLYKKEECETFMNKINSQEYKDSLVNEPIQYLIKIGHGSHGGAGVFLLDKNETKKLNKQYNYGAKCGKITKPLIAQTYVSNPLLLDINNKFDFRVYMLIASTNPLIVYYHDGVLRASLSPYNKSSEERGKHLTNSHLAADIFKKAKKQKVYNMTSNELRDYHLWSFEELQEYLLESGKINDPNWLDNYLRPQFRKAMIHITKMSSQFFWKQSNVYGLFGLDFMLDENFNLWFIESNPNPQLVSINSIFKDVLHSLTTGIFDIEYALYKSRMKRALQVIQRMQTSSDSEFSQWRSEYDEAIKNRYEPEYQPRKNNTYVLILDESKSGIEAYMGNIELECINP